MSSTNIVSQRLRMIVKNELYSNEHILYIDQPVASYWHPETISASIFGLIILLLSLPFFIALFPDYSHRANYETVALIFQYLVLIAPVLMVGIIFLFMPLWRQGDFLNTVYVITNERAMIIVKNDFWSSFHLLTRHPKINGKNTIEYYYLKELKTIYKCNKLNNLGDLRFGVERFYSSRGGYDYREVGFFNIKNLKMVEKLFQQLNIEVEFSPQQQLPILFAKRCQIDDSVKRIKQRA